MKLNILYNNIGNTISKYQLQILTSNVFDYIF